MGYSKVVIFKKFRGHCIDDVDPHVDIEGWSIYYTLYVWRDRWDFEISKIGGAMFQECC